MCTLPSLCLQQMPCCWSILWACSKCRLPSCWSPLFIWSNFLSLHLVFLTRHGWIPNFSCCDFAHQWQQELPFVLLVSLSSAIFCWQMVFWTCISVMEATKILNNRSFVITTQVASSYCTWLYYNHIQLINPWSRCSVLDFSVIYKTIGEIYDVQQHLQTYHCRKSMGYASPNISHSCQ